MKTKIENPILLAVGGHYPFPFPGKAGATANFLVENGNTLQLCIPDLTSTETKALRKGKIEGGFIYEDGNILWVFKFYDKQGVVFTFDAPFDARIIPRESLNLHDITNRKQRLVIDIHVFDQHKTIKVLRAVTMSPKLTLSFLEAVQNQLASPTIEPPNTWSVLSLDDLARTTPMTTLGK